jgi:hypothetical protein
VDEAYSSREDLWEICLRDERNKNMTKEDRAWITTIQSSIQAMSEDEMLWALRCISQRVAVANWCGKTDFEEMLGHEIGAELWEEFCDWSNRHWTWATVCEDLRDAWDEFGGEDDGDEEDEEDDVEEDDG